MTLSWYIHLQLYTFLSFWGEEKKIRKRCSLLSVEVFQRAWEGCSAVFAVHVPWGLCSRRDHSSSLAEVAVLCCRPVFHNSQQVGHHRLFFPHVNFVYKTTSGNWSQNSGIGRLGISLVFLHLYVICLGFLSGGGGKSVNYLQMHISSHSSPEWLWKSFPADLVKQLHPSQ